MRTLVRWSDSSLSMTTPRPEKAEPSRRMAGPFQHGRFGPRLEIARIDCLEAWLLDAEEFEAALHRYHLGRRLRTHVAIGVKPELADAGFLNAADARNEREPLGKPGAVGLDIHHVAAAKHLTAEIGHRAHERDAAGAEQRDA